MTHILGENVKMKKITSRTTRANLLRLFAVITALIVLSLFTTIFASTNFFTPDVSTDGKAINLVTPSIVPAGAESHFQVKIAYAYVGPLPPGKASYIDKQTNETMVAISNYPSAVFLNFSADPSMIRSCDAVLAVYGVKITAATGPTEYYGWGVGTNYTAITQENFAAMRVYAGNLTSNSVYQVKGGSWSYNLTANLS